MLKYFTSTFHSWSKRHEHFYRESSDLDLVIVGKTKLGLSLLGNIQEDFMESDIPYKVGILDYHAVSPAFKAIIDSGHERIYHHS